MASDIVAASNVLLTFTDASVNYDVLRVQLATALPGLTIYDALSAGTWTLYLSRAVTAQEKSTAQTVLANHVPTASAPAQIVEDRVTVPSVNATLDFGSSSARWNTIYCVSVNQSSDRNLKSDIAEIGADVAAAMVDALRPVSYRFIGRPEQRLGFIAQDVAQAMATAGIDPSTNSMYVETPVAEFADPDRLPPAARADGVLRSLDVDQFFPIIIKALQRANARIDSLERELAAVKYGGSR